jgi:hypothetical protein
MRRFESGRLAVDPGSAPMRPDVLFRIASVTKPVGAALALNLVEEGACSLSTTRSRGGCPRRPTCECWPGPTRRWMRPRRRSGR